MQENYKHKITGKVKFHEVDLLNVMNNAVYFNYFEDARVDYIKQLKKNYGLNELAEKGSFFIMAHNDCDYYEPVTFDDEIEIYTRVDFVKNSSFGYKHLVMNGKTKAKVAEGGGVLVYIDVKTRTKKQLPQEFYDAVRDFEEEVKILKDNKDENSI